MRNYTMNFAICAASLLFGATTLAAGEKKLMHCFAFTPLDSATSSDWDAFYKATADLPQKVPGVTKVWSGKLLRPLPIFNTDAESRKKLNAGEKMATAEVTRKMRQYGVCMEMNDEAALKTYATAPGHKDWLAAYEKVREAGTTTFDIIGQ